ncbi:MAG: sulfotransferase domain-containing protein [Acidimicrobiia bacterium]
MRRVGAAALLATRIPTTRWRSLPDFVIIGAQKAGTTSLYAGLVAHPDVRRAFRKEVHFFDTTHYPRVGWYRRHFPIDREHVLTGESSPYYLFHPAVPTRMRAVLPDVSLIAILREPVARAISQYHHARHWGFEDRPIERALEPAAHEVLAALDDAAWYDRADSPARERAYLARGQYAEQLERWFGAFDRDRVLVLDSEELDRGLAIPTAQRFLGLVEHEIPAVPHRNVGSYGSPDPGLVRELAAYFEPHNERLVKLLGRTFQWST